MAFSRSTAAPRVGDSTSSRGSTPAAAPSRPEPGTAKWTFLTNHAHVLVLLARDPDMILREVAVQVGITERAVQRIIADLEQEGYIERQRIGRNNHYQVRLETPLRHAIESHRTIGDLLGLVDGGADA